MSEVHEDAPVQQANPKVESALRLLADALKTLTPEEREAVKGIQAEVDQAIQNGTASDPRLEFCYTIKFSGDRITNAKLKHATDQYIAAVEG